MTAPTDPDQRVEPPFIAAERTMLDGWLDYHRATLFWKCDGLSDAQLKTASVPPATMTLLGLVRHMAEVERSWFAHFLGTETTSLFCTEADPDGEWDNVATADSAADFETLRREISTYRELVAPCALDDMRTMRGDRQISLRWIYTHMIEEYARHNGHADLLRECLDGAVGD
jgi:uncharacterized damage-inducible protein DinB